jgi:two-component system CheB/CheR fusion protein
VIRVWSPGCSTGEEAYSIAILLQERMAVLKQSFKVQVFATDIDSRAIARPAPVSIRPASPPTSRRNGWRVLFSRARMAGPTASTKSLRDMLVFSEQDVIKIRRSPNST